MKILFVATHLKPTEGWGTETLSSVQGLRALGHDVRALVHEPAQGNLCVQYSGLPPPLMMLRNPFAWLKAARAIKWAIREFQPDILHVMTEPYVLSVPFIGKHPPLVLTVNGTYSILPLAFPLTKWLMTRAYKRAKRIVSISEYTKGRLIAFTKQMNTKLSEEIFWKISVWTLGTPPVAEGPSRKEHPEKQILFVGAVKPRKGVLEMVEACGEFAKKSSISWKLNIIGDDSEVEYIKTIKARAQGLGISSNVLFRGRVSDSELAQAYADCDLFMMLSISEGLHFEGYGLVFLEANTRGVPVIGSLNSGCTQSIADGRSGYLVDPKNPSQVAERMKWILEDRKILPEECRKWAKEHSVERQAKELIEQYNKAL